MAVKLSDPVALGAADIDRVTVNQIGDLANPLLGQREIGIGCSLKKSSSPPSLTEPKSVMPSVARLACTTLP